MRISDVELCTMCKSCVEACPRGAIEIGQDNSRFIFRIESTGALPPERLLLKASEAIIRKCKEFAKQVKKL